MTFPGHVILMAAGVLKYRSGFRSDVRATISIACCLGAEVDGKTTSCCSLFEDRGAIHAGHVTNHVVKRGGGCETVGGGGVGRRTNDLCLRGLGSDPSAAW